ncbi:MAG: hypothetical protein DWH73_03675 [Planctomycetota bacterium]|nr:MAG: hypothetical protein DWH73_03675 [Planctomycetota bacterium]RLT08460.1 MAG: hypothetical protein DWI24_10885 [Planctomycetota bacterium]
MCHGALVSKRGAGWANQTEKDRYGLYQPGLGMIRVNPDDRSVCGERIRLFCDHLTKQACQVQGRK